MSISLLNSRNGLHRILVAQLAQQNRSLSRYVALQKCDSHSLTNAFNNKTKLTRHFTNSVSNKLDFTKNVLDIHTKGPADLTQTLGTDISVLSNGVKVVSHMAPGHFVGLGVYVETGSKYETNETLGCAHVLDRMTFKSTKDASADKIVSEIENLGGSIMANCSRDSMMYQSVVFPQEIEKVASILSQVVRYPLYLNDEIEEMKNATTWEINSLIDRQDILYPELLHSLVFRDPIEDKPAGLGNSLLCPLDNLQNMDANLLHKFHNQWYTPNRITVAGVGIPHEYLKELATVNFGDMPSVPKELSDAQTLSIPKFRYQSGIHVDDTSHLPPPANPDIPVLTRVTIGFESIPVTDPDIYALATLVSLLGGGNSFSAGGPGKGMYTRLYRNVLCKFYWVEECSVTNYCYMDGGFFGISASVPPGVASHNGILRVISNQFIQLLTHIGLEELNRAKNQLKSQVLMDMETRLSELEDLGRQVLHSGTHTSVATTCERIDSLTVEDLQRVARRIILKTNEKPRTDFNDPNLRISIPSGDGKPTVLVSGPVGPDKVDSLKKEINNVLKEWELI